MFFRGKFRRNNQQLTIAARNYLAQPLPDKNQQIEKCEFLALDFETTGLNPKKEAILSIGYSLVKGRRLILKNNGHHIVRLNRELTAKSVVIHHITDERMKQGSPLHEVIDVLLEQMMGRTLLVHYAQIEREFLNAAFKRTQGRTLPFQLVDTMQLEQKILGPIFYSSGVLRLANIRTRYKLPRYKAHNALEDAVSTAELFLAQVSSREHNNPGLLLKDYLAK